MPLSRESLPTQVLPTRRWRELHATCVSARGGTRKEKYGATPKHERYRAGSGYRLIYCVAALLTLPWQRVATQLRNVQAAARALARQLRVPYANAPNVTLMPRLGDASGDRHCGPVIPRPRPAGVRKMPRPRRRIRRCNRIRGSFGGQVRPTAGRRSDASWSIPSRFTSRG